jgi:hypothetical protein
MDCLPQLHLAAIHAQPGYQGDTIGLGVFCRLKNNQNAQQSAQQGTQQGTQQDWALGAGRFRNSLAEHSNYASAAYQPWTLRTVRFGGFGGIINGYSNYRNGGYFVYAGALASVPVSFGEIHLVGIPMTSHTPAVVEISVAVRF